MNLPTNPNSVGLVFSVLVWLPITAWVVCMVGWMIMDEVDTLFGIIAVCLAIGLGFATVKPPAPGLNWIPFLAVCLTMAFYFPVREGIRRWELIAIDIEQIRSCCERLALRPGDVYAIVKMSEILASRGRTLHAVQLLEGTIAGQPKNLFDDEWKMVAKWRMSLGAQTLAPGTACPKCGRVNMPGQYLCSGCGSQHLLELARGGVAGFSQWRLAFFGWSLLAAIAVIFPYLQVGTSGVVAKIALALVGLTGGVMILIGLIGGGKK
ncbi:MAG: hypothetical protein KF836_07070 [Fimbriimonadaceae bacterium]|nr:hypothetical protein [Fimbriimonadaceae bacterium]